MTLVQFIHSKFTCTFSKNRLFGLGLKHVQTDNDKYDHLFISLLDFLNSLPIFNFTSMTEKAAC